MSKECNPFPLFKSVKYGILESFLRNLFTFTRKGQMKRKEYIIMTKGMTIEEWLKGGNCGFPFYIKSLKL